MLAIRIALFVLLAVVFIQAAHGSGGVVALSVPDLKASSSLTPNSNADHVQEKMADALHRLNAWRMDQANKTSKLPDGSVSSEVSASDNPFADNSSLNNSAINGTLQADSSALNRSTLSGETSAGAQGVASNSRASFNGYYGITASRHEMGKSDIKSSMQLNGAFEVDKSVKFQDRGF